MNIKKLKQLRATIAIPLTEAKNLLDENDNDVDACVQVFHQKNLVLSGKPSVI